MAERRGLRCAFSSRLAPLGVFLTLACAAALLPAPALGSATATDRVLDERPLPVPGAFRLPASNGYTLYVAGVPPHAKRPGKVLIFVYAKGKRVTYSAPATVTEASIQSDLGELGEISVTFQRSNRAAIFSCGKRKISFDSGEYEGRIEFHGEEGYTSVEATTAPGNFDFWGAGFCEGSWESGGSPEHARGAELFVRNPGLGPELSVRKSRPGAAVLILAWDSEFTNGILIEREIGLWMPGSDFTFDRRLRTATVRPPAPFAGSAQFDLTKKAGQRWSGDLMVDLPGRMGVPLTGPLLRATLVPSE